MNLAERFQAVVRAGPSRLAVRSRTASWTYEELDAVAGRVAHALLDRSPDLSRPVLLFLETDAPLLAAMLGTLRAGLFYVPVDPTFAPERAALLAGLAGPSLVLTRRGLRAAAEVLAEGVLEIDDLLIRGQEAPAVAVPPEAPAYLLFTSGSTGTPKGIVQTHRNVLANVEKLAAGLRLTAEDRLTLLTSASYGASVSDVYGALLTGAAVLPFEPRAVSPDGWRDWVAAEGVTIWHSVPGLFRSLARAVDDPGQVPSLRLFKLGGEPVFAADLELFERRFREGTVFHVGLGMTEMNVICQWFAAHGTECPGPVTPVGRPAAGTTALLLGPQGDLVEPAGDEGELALVSATLPPAYWARPDLTARAFRPLPGRPEERLFLTGDLVRRLPDGNLLHLGRRDREIKIRGLRVDAQAVENALRRLPCVRDAAIGLSSRGERGLVAWVVPEKEARLGTLRTELSAVLPSEAVPSWIVSVPELPTLGPGKIDRERLPDPPAGRRDLATPFVAPETSEEARIAKVFGEVLGVETVGALDDFFALGGTSLLSLDALLGLERSLERPVDPALFVEEATPRGIARRLSDRREILTTLSRGEGCPVFFIPGHGGGEGPDLLQLARIARRARLDGPCYALRFPIDPPSTADDLLDRWSEAVLEKQGEGPWRLAAFCAGGSLGVALAARLGRSGRSGDGEPHLVLHDALFPTRASPLRRFLRRLREPWGDDLIVRALHHLREAARQGRMRWTRAFGYLRARTRSAARGIERMRTSTVQRMVSHQDAYLRLAVSCRPEPWPGRTLLIVTPARRGRGLPRLWRRVAPRLAVLETGADAEGESAVGIREFFEPPRSRGTGR
jgi:amino acid adenylation domain-containing protein